MAKKYRYPGAPPFAYEDRKLFYGRDDEIDRFYKFINREELVVLYSRSGLGKSSMLNAGIVPKLISESGFQPYSVKFSSYEEDNTTSPLDIIVKEINRDKTDDSFLQKITKPDGSLWYHLKQRQIELASDKDFLLIFDQFENLFTFKKGVREFGQQVASLLNVTIPQKYRDALQEKLTVDPDFLSKSELDQLYKPFKVHIVFAIRSDKMALLNRLKDSLPGILNKTFVLEPLNRAQAEDAIVYPAYIRDDEFLSPPFDYADEALDKMLTYLSDEEEHKIESFQLQILCQYVEENIVIGKKKRLVEASDLGIIANIFRDYYDNIIKQLPSNEQYDARLLIEEGLIFEEDMRRISLYEGQIFKKYSISEKTLKELVNKRLLRAEPGVSGGFSYELSHDTLVAPILKVKAKRKLAEAEAARLLEERERKAREKAESERRRRKRNIVLAVAAAFVLLGLVFGGWLFNNWMVIKKQKARLIETKDSLELQREIQNNLILSLQESQKKNEEANRSLDRTNKKLALNADSLERSIRKLNITTADLRKSQNNLTVALDSARRAKEKAKENFALAEQRFEQLQSKIGSQFMEKASEEAEEKNMNVAKLYALNALRAEPYLEPADWEKAARYAKTDDYPVKVFTPEFTQQLHYSAYAPNEKIIATAGEGSSTINLWNAKTGKSLGTLTGHTAEVNHFTFSPNSKQLASGTLTGEVFVWNVESGQLIKTLMPGYAMLNTIHLQYNTDGSILFFTKSSSSDNSITLWETENYENLFTFPGIPYEVNSLSVSPDGRYIAKYNPLFNSIVIFAVPPVEDFYKNDKLHRTKKLRKKFDYETTLDEAVNEINCQGFSHDNTWFAVGSGDNVYVWDVFYGSKVATLSGHEGTITSLAFRARDNMLATGDDQGMIKLWKINPDIAWMQDSQSDFDFGSKNKSGDLSQQMLVATLRNHFNPVASVAFIENGNKLVTLGHEERSVKIWDLTQTNKIVHTNFDTVATRSAIARAGRNFNLKLEGTNVQIIPTEVEKLYQRAASAQYDTARVRIYHAILKKNPNEEDALYGLANAYFNLQDYPNAIQYFNAYLTRHSDDYDSRILLGYAYYGEGAYDDALITFRKATELNPGDYLGWHFRGLAQMTLGNSEEARANYMEAVKRNQYIEGIYNHIGNTWYMESNYKKAVEYYQQEIDQNPNHKWAYSNLATAYHQLKNNEKAIENYSKALDIDPYFVEALDSISVIYNEEKDYVKSFETYIELLKTNPDNETLYWYYLAGVALNGNVDYAITFINNILVENPSWEEYSEVWNIKGLAWFKKKEYDRAIDNYTRALEIEPENVSLINNMALALDHGRQKAEAAVYFQKLTALLKGELSDADDLSTRALARIKLGEPQKAYADLEKAEKNNSKNERIYRTWAIYYALLNENRKAISNLQKSFDLGYSDPAWVEGEPALDGLRNDSAYYRIVQKMKNKKQSVAEAQIRLYEYNAYIARGDAFAMNWEYKYAVPFYKQAYAMKPEEVVYEKLTNALNMAYENALENAEYDTAYRYIEELWQTDHDYYDAYGWNNIGRSLYTARHYEQANRFFYHAIEADPSYKWAYGNMGNAYLVLKDTSSAIGAYEEALEIDEDYVFALNGLAEIYRVKKDYSMALGIFNRVLDIEPSNSYMLARLAAIYDDKDHLDSTIYFREQTVKYTPEYSTGWGNLSWSYLFAEKYEKALEAANKGYSLDTANTWILTNKGHALLFLGRVDEAKKVYSGIKAVNYDGAPLKEALLNDFDAFEAAGIKNEYFDEMRKLLMY